tara:strand:- start:1281 stop:1505 length:225 start_codon:yes stop_codon:yes gene_type:complete
MIKHSKSYYLALPYEEKLKTLKDALRIDFTYYLLVSKYYLSVGVEQGGLPTKIVEKEFEKGLKRNHYFKNNINE